jgi:hypothetical protein
MGHEKTSVLAFNTLFEGSGIRHSIAGLQLTHDMFIAGYFMLLFDLTADRAASEGHSLLPDQGNIRLELRFNKPFPEAVTCPLYLEYDNSVRIYINCALFQPTFNNGNGANTMYAKDRSFICRRVSM